MKTHSFTLTAILVLAGLQFTNAQITTSEVKVEDMGGITSIEGNVGIGTTGPTAKLEISQNEDPTSDSALKISEPNNSQTIYLHLADNAWGEYGYLSLGGNTQLRGNGEPSHFDGNVGIGTTSPQTLLDVNGIITSRSEIRTLSGNPGVLFDESDVNDKNWHLQVNGGDLKFYEVNDARTNWNQKMIIKNGSGNVGIGTITPSTKLQVIAEPASAETIFRVGVEDALNDYFSIKNATGAANQFMPVLKGYHSSDNREALLISGEIPLGQDNGNWAVVRFDARQSNGPITNRPLFQWRSYDEIKMTMDSDGNVGIGITNPGYKLQVNGTVRATTFSAVSPPNWPDFVFEDDFELKPLAEVEIFIQKNKHLPDIPSEKELQKTGLDLPKMDARLLQKIEELTLYIIDQNKKIEYLQKQINELKTHKK